MNRRIIVIGSLNADLVQALDRLPQSGETISGGELRIVPGGKGANQACAAARMGGIVSMIGQVGDDPFGPRLVENLANANVDTSLVRVAHSATGTAVIFVLPSGDNVIVISPGANGSLTPDLVEPQLASLAKSDLVLTQLEVPLETTLLSLKIARHQGAITILDPAPAQALPPEMLTLVDYLTPNQTEAAMLLKSDRVIETPEEAACAGSELLALGPTNVLVKMGAQGVCWCSTAANSKVPGFEVQAVDSTAAGDTFNGAFAASLAEGVALEQAIRFANAAGALSVTRHGAQSSIPSRKEVDEFLRVRTT